MKTGLLQTAGNQISTTSWIHLFLQRWSSCARLIRNMKATQIWSQSSRAPFNLSFRLIPVSFALIDLKCPVHSQLSHSLTPSHIHATIYILFPPLKSQLSFSEAAAASLYVLFTWFPHGTNCKVFIGWETCSQRESHHRQPITRRHTSDVICYWEEGFMGTVGFMFLGTRTSFDNSFTRFSVEGWCIIQICQVTQDI